MPKITFMGAGSSVFAKNVLGDSMMTPALEGSTIALYDIDAKRLQESHSMLEAINRNFGSLDELKVQIGRAAAGLFGSGWVWLAEDPSGRLAVVSEQNAGNPMRHGMKPLLAIDVWEHAYYIDYRNRRADAVEALWGVVDWKVVGDRYAEK